MSHSRLWIAIAAVAALAATAGYRLGDLSRQAEAPTQNSRAPIPLLTLPDLSGRPQALSQWAGKIVVLNYWATWCPPCREEMPGFARLQDKLGPKGVQFVGISIDQADKIAKFQEETPVNYPLLIGEFGAMQTSIDLGNERQGLPFTAIFDRQGRLHAFKLGRYAEADLEKTLNGLLAR